MRRVLRIAGFVVILFVFTSIVSQVQMHPAYKDLPAWFVDDVWRPVVVFVYRSVQ